MIYISIREKKNAIIAWPAFGLWENNFFDWVSLKESQKFFFTLSWTACSFLSPGWTGYLSRNSAFPARPPPPSILNFTLHLSSTWFYGLINSLGARTFVSTCTTVRKLGKENEDDILIRYSACTDKSRGDTGFYMQMLQLVLWESGPLAANELALKNALVNALYMGPTFWRASMNVLWIVALCKQYCLWSVAPICIFSKYTAIA